MRKLFVPVLSVAFAAVSFGAVSASATQSITFTSVTHNFGIVVDGSTETYGVKVTNTSSTAFPFAISLTGSSEYVQNNGCGTSIPAGGYCEIVFTFAPTAASSATATWSLTANGATFTPSNGGTLSGSGTASVGFTVTSAKHDFETQVVNTTGATTFGVVLANSTAEAITLTIDTTSADHVYFPLKTNNCGATLPAHGNCNLAWKFYPTSVAAYAEDFPISGTDAVTGTPIQLSSGGSAVSTIKLRGTGIAASNVNLSTGGHAFGEITNGLTSTAYGVTLTNGTAGTVTLSYGTVPTDFKIVANACGSTLAGGASCEIQFKFEPIATGQYSGTYTIAAADSTGGTLPVYTNGATTTGLLFTGDSITGGLALDSSTHIFGVFTPGQTSATFETQLKNTSADTLNIALSPDGGSDDASFVIVTGTCGATLTPNAFCNLKVNYKPTATGTQVLTESITASDAVTGETVGVYDSTMNTIVTSVVETGYAIATATFEATSTSHAFGEIGVNGTSAGYATTLFNSTTDDLTLSTSWSNPAESADFTLYSTPCGTSLVAHGVCVLKFEFTPVSAGSFDNIYQVSGTSAGYTGTAQTELTGTGIN